MCLREEESAHLVKLGSEEVETGDDAAVGPQLVLLHDLLAGLRIRIDLMRIRIRIQHSFLLRIRIQGLMT